MIVVSASDEIVVAIDYDVVVLRQHIRQRARALGLGLLQQTKCATAATTIARGLLTRRYGSTFVTLQTEHLARPILQITCTVPLSPTLKDTAQLESMLRLDEVCRFVDDLDLALDEMTACVTLRIWLDTPAY
jgi:hypothetical protein